MTDRGWWLIVTGTGRCGTGYIAMVLNSVGVNCTHEGVFQPDPPDMTLEKIHVRQNNPQWGWQADSSFLAAPYLDLLELEGMTIVHLVREAKKVIDSQMRIRAFEEADNVWRKWQLRWLPELQGKPALEQAAIFYTRWNAMIEPHATLRWRVEDDVTGLLDQLGIEWHGKEVYADKLYNSRVGWDKSDVDLDTVNEPLRTELRAMNDRYGYEWPHH